MHAKWQQLGGAAFARDLVGEEVVQADGIRHAKFSKDVRVTWQEGAGAHWFSDKVARAWERKLKPDGTTDNVAIMDQVHLTGPDRFGQGPASAFSTGYSVYGSYAISGAIRQKYWEAGGPWSGELGWLVGDQTAAPQGDGCLKERTHVRSPFR